jgi:hypothetical protein
MVVIFVYSMHLEVVIGASFFVAWRSMRFLMSLCVVSVLGFAANTGKSVPITFHKDVLPVLQAKCQGCHRPGEAAPFSLLTYAEARPYARAMREAVLAKRMPPWFADPHIGKFTNDWSLKEAEKQTLVAWADQGAKEGNKADAKPNPVFTTGWQIPEPDMVFEMPAAYAVPASGTVPYVYYIIPTGLKEDKWVRMAEARPGFRSTVHHIIAFVREPGSPWLAGAPVNQGFVPGRGGKGSPDAFLAGYAPGMLPMKLRPGQAMLLKAGSDIVFQMHYTANGKAGEDRSKVGIVFAKEPVKQRVHMLQVQNGRFTIPAGADNVPVAAALTLAKDVELLDLQPHMHARGKTALMKAVYPTGEDEKLLSIQWDFNWQLNYELPAGKMLPKGTRIEGLNTYDNTPNNKFNPDPKVDVRWGDQSWWRGRGARRARGTS